jgi:hypothetical protein
MKTPYVWTAIAVGFAGCIAVMVMALFAHDKNSTDEKRAACLKMCEPRLIEEFSDSMCRCDKTDFNLPPRCEATCLPRLVKEWNRSTGLCECEDTKTWGDNMKDPSEFHPLWFYDAGSTDAVNYKKFSVELPTDVPEVELIYRRMVEAGAPASAYPSNFGQGESHSHTP